jgi:hypothetical protein
MKGQALIAGGWSLIIMGLFVLSPALWLVLDQSVQNLTGAPLLGIVIGGGGILAPLILTALGTAGIVFGSWMITNGNRRRREPSKPREPVRQPDKMPAKQPDKITPKPQDKPTPLGE